MELNLLTGMNQRRANALEAVGRSVLVVSNLTLNSSAGRSRFRLGHETLQGIDAVR